MRNPKDFDADPAGGEPRYRLEGNSLEELLAQLQAIAPEPGDLRFLNQKERQPRAADEADAPERMTHGDLRRLADELSGRFQETTPTAQVVEEEEADFSHSDWQPYRRSEPGDVRQRLLARRARLMKIEAGYVWLHDAMLSNELEDREEAVSQLEQVGDAARIERLAEHSPHRVTRRHALETLFRLKAVPALESAALYIRPEVFTPKNPKPTEDEGTPKRVVEFYDDTRDLAVDLLARLSDEGTGEALHALLRIIRYDFARDVGARIRALRRVGERLEQLETQRDWEGLTLLYRESRNPNIRRDAARRLAAHMEELESGGEIDALLAIADTMPELRDEAEAIVRRLSRSEGSKV